MPAISAPRGFPCLPAVKADGRRRLKAGCVTDPRLVALQGTVAVAPADRARLSALLLELGVPQSVRSRAADRLTLRREIVRGRDGVRSRCEASPPPHPIPGAPSGPLPPLPKLHSFTQTSTLCRRVIAQNAALCRALRRRELTGLHRVHGTGATSTAPPPLSECCESWGDCWLTSTPSTLRWDSSEPTAHLGMHMHVLLALPWGKLSKIT
jgi:hypothetical protein